MERFRREIHLARKVTHPNACRIFDLFHHQAGSSDITFLTIELLSGESLSSFLRRTGKMTTIQALPLIQQMVDALSAAHKAGIIHRDFKSANVTLVPSKSGDWRVVVTDFGLARAVEGADSELYSLTGSAEISGTPAYMAPEQLEGGQPTPATDIYALGIVIYEMLTGTWPFIGDTPIAVALRRLKENAPSPRIHVPDLDSNWEATILRCLKRNPADRFNSAEELWSALQSGMQPVVAKSKLNLQFAAIILLLGLAGLLGYQFYKSRETPKTPVVTAPTVAARKSVAVLGLKNHSGLPEFSWLSTALSEMLTTELAAGEKLRTISGENVARMKIDLSLPDADTFAKDTLSKIRTNLGTDFVVIGSYIVVGQKEHPQLRVDLRIQNAIDGEVIASVSESGTENELLDLVSRTGNQLREKLGAGNLTQSQIAEVNASKPANTEAARLYAQGVEKLVQYDSLSAKDFLEKAVAADPNFALAHFKLSEAYESLGYVAKSESALRKAYELSKSLSREEKLLVEAEYQNFIGKTEKAVKLYEVLYGFFPDNIEYGMQLALLQYEVYKGKEASKTLAELRKLPAPLGTDPSIDLTEAFITEDQNRALAVTEAAIAKAKQLNFSMLKARAKLHKAGILFELNRGDEARELYLELRKFYGSIGDRSKEAWALRRIGVLQPNIDIRLKYYREAESICREIGDFNGVSAAQGGIATELVRQGKTTEAKKLYKNRLELARKSGDKREIASSLYMLVNHSYPPAGLKLIQEAYQIHREIGDIDSAAQDQYALASSLQTLGRFDEALRIAQEGLVDLKKNGWKKMELAMHYQIAWILQDQGKITAAHEEIEIALDKKSIWESSVVVAHPAYAFQLLEEGPVEKAEDYLHKLAEKYRTDRRDGTVPLWLALEARAKLEQQKIQDAEKLINEAEQLSKTLKDDELSIVIATEAARIHTASNPKSLQTSAEMLSKWISQAHKEGYFKWELWAKLALGEIQIKYGDAAQGRKTLEVLKKEATATGYGSVVNKANKLLMAKQHI
jgi:tetratricopeptide (TPR) repeat protein